MDGSRVGHTDVAHAPSPPPASPPPASPYRFPSYDPVFGVKVLDPVDPQQHPFSLNITGNIESRYFGFARSQETAVDSTGAVQSVRNLSLFEFPRWWLQVDGFVGRPEITYSLMLFGTSASTTGLEYHSAGVGRLQVW